MKDAELIARLRNSTDPKCWEAADRIEALIAERDALFRRATLAEEWRDHDKTRAEAAEAKLAKAVEALRACQPTSNPLIPAQEQLDRINAWWAMEARATLAEIKGESHD